MTRKDVDLTAGSYGSAGGGGGNLGRYNGMPVLKHERGVLWFKPIGTGAANASSAGNADTGASDNIATYGTTNNDDIFIYLIGQFDFNGSVMGLNTGLYRITVCGVGFGATEILNSNVAANGCISMNGKHADVFGFNCIESTPTVNGFYIAAYYGYIHDNECNGNVQVGVSISSGCWYTIIEHNHIRTATHGIYCATNGIMNIVQHNFIYEAQTNGIYVGGNTSDGWLIDHNHIDGSAGTTDTGINIALADNHIITNNYIVGCVAQKADTGSDSHWENNHGTLETSWTTALDGTEQDVFGTAAAHKTPLNDTGIVRLYPDFSNISPGDLVNIAIYRKNDGINSRIATRIEKSEAVVMPNPVYEVRYTKTRTLRVTVSRDTGAIADLPFGIEEAVS